MERISFIQFFTSDILFYVITTKRESFKLVITMLVKVEIEVVISISSTQWAKFIAFLKIPLNATRGLIDH